LEVGGGVAQGRQLIVVFPVRTEMKMNDSEPGEAPGSLTPSMRPKMTGVGTLAPLKRTLMRAPALLLAGFLAACSLAPTSSGTLTVGHEIAETALRMKGVPYVYGGNTPAGFDCSGLVHYAYGQAGIAVPRNSQAQFAAATRISQQQAQPGDLLFFVTDKKWHVAIYVGKNKFVHAPAPGWTVSTASMENDYYREKLVGVGRLTPR
jgi:cell wall-associated NlpC family hydrolase